MMLPTVVLEKTLERPLDCKEIQPVNPKRTQPWIFIGKSDAEAETPVLWPPDVKSRLTGKDPDAGKDWRQEEKGTTEDEMVGWHYWLNGHEFEQAPGNGEGQGSLACCSHGVTTSQTWLSDWTTICQDTIISRYLIKIFPSPIPICFPSFLSVISLPLKLSQGLWPLRWIAKFLTQS